MVVVKRKRSLRCWKSCKRLYNDSFLSKMETRDGIIKTANYTLRETSRNEYYGMQTESKYGRGVY